MACPAISAPVCGANRVTYPNRCQAECTGVRVVADAPCGEPTREPCICTLEYAPVCAGGRTFGNACAARCAGYHYIDYRGRCADPSRCSTVRHP